MNTKPTLRMLAVAALLLLTINSWFSNANAQGAAFTYQGQLQNNGSPANGSYSFAFSLYNTSTGGSAIAGPLTNSAVGVTNGLFTVLVDFGPNAFTGTSNWLQIAVATNGSGTFTNLSPRQQVTPTPYALYTPNAGSAASANSVAGTNITGTIALANLPPTVLTNDEAGVTIGGTNSVAPLTVPPTLPASAIGSVGNGSSPYSVVVAGRYAYVANAGPYSLQVIDVSAPAAPAE